MAPSAARSALRDLLERQIAQLLPELERAFEAQLSENVAAEVEKRAAQISSEAGVRARGVFANQLNEAARRLGQASNAAELGATLVDVAGTFAAGAALLRVAGRALVGEHLRGAPAEHAEAFRRVGIPLSSAPAIAEAVKNLDPVTALPSAGEVSAVLADLAGGSDGTRAFIVPIVTSGQAAAVLYAWGAVQSGALEVLAQLAAALWSAFARPSELVTIRAAQESRPSSWEALSADDQRIHLRAQRFARVQVAEMRLAGADAVAAGRQRRDLYGALRDRIDGARAAFRKDYFETSTSMVDYLHLELLRTLANDDPELLGKDYPGPLV